MSSPPPPSSAIRRFDVDEAVQRVRDAGGRVTGARRALLEDLYGRGGRVTAEDLAVVHGDIDVATIYRSLAQFEEVGVVEHVHLGHGPAAYRWAGTRSIAAVCVTCGIVVDIPSDELDDLADRLQSTYGLRLSLGHFALSVHCARCR